MEDYNRIKDGRCNLSICPYYIIGSNCAREFTEYLLSRINNE
jgi:hypothetical protein